MDLVNTISRVELNVCQRQFLQLFKEWDCNYQLSAVVLQSSPSGIPYAVCIASVFATPSKPMKARYLQI